MFITLSETAWLSTVLTQRDYLNWLWSKSLSNNESIQVIKPGKDSTQLFLTITFTVTILKTTLPHFTKLSPHNSSSLNYRHSLKESHCVKRLFDINIDYAYTVVCTTPLDEALGTGCEHRLLVSGISTNGYDSSENTALTPETLAVLSFPFFYDPECWDFQVPSTRV